MVIPPKKCVQQAHKTPTFNDFNLKLIKKLNRDFKL